MEKKLSKQVENTVGKGEIAHYEQFLLFPLCFQKACFPEASKGVIVWEWVKFTLKCLLQLVSIWTSLKFCCLVMGITENNFGIHNTNREKNFNKNLNHLQLQVENICR